MKKKRMQLKRRLFALQGKHPTDFFLQNPSAHLAHCGERSMPFAHMPETSISTLQGSDLSSLDQAGLKFGSEENGERSHGQFALLFTQAKTLSGASGKVM